MNASPEPDPDFESLLRQRAFRLAVPDPAWRAEILNAIQSRPVIATPRPRRSLWRKEWIATSLAACWLTILLLNWSAQRETKRFSHYASAQAASVVFGDWNKPVLLAAASPR